LWRANETDEWLAALVSIPGQETHNFSSLEALFDYLKNQEEPLFTSQPSIPAKSFTNLLNHR
jgi:hypothetical protein